MSQPVQPPTPPPSSAPPAPTNQPQPQGQPSTGQPTPQQPPVPQAQPQQGWPQQPAYPQQPHQGYPQYQPVMPIPPTLAQPAGNDGGQGNGDSGQDLSKLPQWVQKQIADLRDENAKRRVSERTAVVNQHAWVAAQQLGVNGQALFGSLAWQKAAEQLDPSKPDFGRHLAEMIHTTLRDNPWMAAQQPQPAYSPPPQGQPDPQQVPPGVQPGQQPPTPAPQGYPGYPPPQPYPGAPAGYPPAPYGAPQPMPPGWLRPPTSGAEFAAGNGAGAPITEAQLAQMTPDQIAEAMEKGQLNHLM